MRIRQNLFLFGLLLLLSACGKLETSPLKNEVDSLNARAYRFRYINTDSTRLLANEAFSLSKDYNDGRNEARWNLAFVAFQQMDFDGMDSIIDEIRIDSRKHLIHLCADMMEMKAAQRTGDGEHFFKVKSTAERRIRRITGREERLTAHEKELWTYAQTEFHIIASTYYFYQEQDSMARAELVDVPYLLKTHVDTAQWVYYNYMLGPGGLVEGQNVEDITLQEFDYLFNAYITSRRNGMKYFEANCLQAFSTMFLDNDSLIQSERTDAYNLLRLQVFENYDDDSYMPLTLAERALKLFKEYGDLYQTACTYRSLGEIYFHKGDYEQSLDSYANALHCVNEHHLRYYGDISPDTLSIFNPDDVERCVEGEWIKDTLISTFPEWIAGIRQQLSLTYSALGNKQASDYNRNFYLELVQATNQNLELENRMAELRHQNSALHWRMLLCLMLVVLALILATLFRFRLTRRTDNSLRELKENRWSALLDFKQWNEEELKELAESKEEIEDKLVLTRHDLEENKRKNAENRAKVSLAHNIVPFLDRIGGEVLRMKQSGHIADERRDYIVELSQQIEKYNALLTQWITMQRGQLSLHITSFPLKKLFQIVAEGHYSFDQKGISLVVNQTDASVKADESLTMFMINTLCDNARKFTPKGGTVTLSAECTDDFVEVSVTDTGCGLSEEDVETLNNSKVYDSSRIGNNNDGKGFGFGLMNCRGIIEKYKKTSSFFSACDFGVKSKLGQGSTFYFRLPRVIRMLVLIFLASTQAFASETTDYYDSLYLANVEGRYEDAVYYGGKAIEALNKEHPDQPPMLLNGKINVQEDAPELKWAKEGVKADYDLIVGLRNELSLAALALNDWDLYKYNNRCCIRMHRFTHQDKELPTYFMRLEQAHKNSNILMVLILIASVFSLYYGYRLIVRTIFDKRRDVNALKDYLLRLFTIARESPAPQEFLSQTSSYPQMRQWARKYQTQVADLSVIPQHTLREEIASLSDEDAKLNFEENRLYVQNQILDNCLSTIKHESMYYPSRIRLLAERIEDKDIDQLHELVKYYHQLYTLFCRQADAQVSQPSFRRHRIDTQTLSANLQEMMTRLCRKANVNAQLQIEEPQKETSKTLVWADSVWLLQLFESLLQGMLHEGGQYRLTCTDDGNFLRFTIHDSTTCPSAEQLDALFFPDSEQISFLVAKQILREHDTFMGHPGCRLVAQASDDGGYEIFFTLLKASET